MARVAVWIAALAVSALGIRAANAQSMTLSSAKLPDAKNDFASAALVGFDLHFHTLAKATLTGLYGR